MTLSWDVPPAGDNVVSYEYRIDPDPVAGTSGWTLWQSFDDVSYTVTGLTNGTTYSFQVRANNNQGDGPDSDTVTATPSGPPAAPDLRADPSDGEVRLYWANPDDSSITKYQKHEKKGDEAYGLWEDISFPDTVDISSDDPIQYTVTGLDNDGTAYTFQVRAFNNGGIGAVGTATATPTASETAPAQMSGLIAAVSGVSGGTGGQVRFTWDNPGDSAIDKYQYRYDGSSSNPDIWDRDWSDVPSSIGTTTSYPAGAGTVDIPGSNVKFYEFRAVNDGADDSSTSDVNEGGGPATAVRVDRLNTPTTSAQPPATPTDLTATATPGQVALGWTVPSGTGVTAPTNHEYRQSTDGGESFGNWMSTGKATAGHTVTTLIDGKEYTFEVRGFTGSGDSKVNGASTRVGPVIPGAPNAPTGLAVTAIEDDTSTTDADESNPNALNLIWTPGAGIDGVTLADYEYRQSVSGAVSWSAWNSISGDGSETTYTVIELLPSTTYSFQVRAVAGALRSDPSDSASGTTADPPADQPLVAPDAPTGLRAAAGNEQATLTWSNPDNRYILKYRYRVAPEGTAIDTADWQQINGSDKDTTSHTVTDLTNGATYSFQVQAVGAGSMIGTASETVTATPRVPPTQRPRPVPTPVVEAPAAPTGLSASAGDGEVTLTWDDPNNPDILSYQYRQAAEGTDIDSEDWRQIAGSNQDTTSFTVTGLTNGVAYTFQVQALGSSNTVSDASNTATATPKAEPPPTEPPPTEPPQGRSVTVSNPDGTVTTTVEKPSEVVIALSVNTESCGTEFPQGSLNLCLEIDATGPTEMLEDDPALITIHLSASRWSALRNAYLNGQFWVFKRSDAAAAWANIPACLNGATDECYEVTEYRNKSATVTIRNVRSLSQYAIAAVLPRGGGSGGGSGGGFTSSSRGSLARVTGTPAPTVPVIVPPTVRPTAVIPTQQPTVPPTPVPPTAIPPTAVPPTAVPPTQVPSTAVPPTAVPPTPTEAPTPPVQVEAPTPPPPTPVDAPTPEPTEVTAALPPTAVAPAPTPIPPLVDEPEGNLPPWLLIVIIAAVLAVGGMGFLAFRLLRAQ